MEKPITKTDTLSPDYEAQNIDFWLKKSKSGSQLGHNTKSPVWEMIGTHSSNSKLKDKKYQSDINHLADQWFKDMKASYCHQ